MKKSNFNFYFFGNTRWDFFPHREHFFSFELARKGYYISFIQEVPSLAGIFKNFGVRNYFSGEYFLNRYVPQLKVYRTYCVPTFFRSSLTPVLDSKIIRRWFKDVLKNNVESPSVFFTTMPLWFDLLDESINLFDIIIYDVCDDLAISARNDRALSRLNSAHQRAVASADLVTCSSAFLKENIETQYDREPLLIRNGVDEIFIQEKPSCPNNRIKKVGIIGVFDVKPELYDFGLIQKCAKYFNDCEIILIGRTNKQQREKMMDISNVMLTGIVSHKQLLKKLKSFNVCLIPFVKSKTVAAINPLKLYEYLAYGKPVVATKTFDTDDLDNCIYVAGGASEFIDKISAALDERDEEKKLRRLDAVKEKTWGSRVDTLLNSLQQI